MIKGTKKAKLVGASNASAWITAGAGLGGGAITGPAAKAIGLAKVGLKTKVFAKGGVYFSASVGMQQIFFGKVCWMKAGTAGAFGMIGTRFDNLEKVVANVGVMIGLSIGKEIVSDGLIRLFGE